MSTQNQDISSLLKQVICKAVNSVQVPNLNRLKPEEIHLEHPDNEAWGDYSSNIAMAMFSKSKVKSQKSKLNSISNSAIQQFNNPAELANAINISLEKQDLPFIEKITVVNGFINISIKNDWLVSQVERVIKEGEKYGSTDIGKEKKLMVEFSHPNTHKAFHIGHLRNISTGESIVRILEANGFQVIRANYQGDVGLHIAKCLWGITHCHSVQADSLVRNLYRFLFKPGMTRKPSLDEKIEFLGKCYAAGSKAYEEDDKAKQEIRDINFLIYASAQRFNQERGIKLSSTDYLKFVKGKDIRIEEVYKLWKETRQWSLDYFETIYKRVDSHFDRLYFESECLRGVDLSYEAMKKKVLGRSKGAVVFDGKAYGLDTRVFVNSLGLPTYEGKELALSQMETADFGQLDKIIHVVGPEQSSFFRVTFKVEELLGLQKDQQYHLAYGWVRLKKGKMSSRLGQVVLGEWLLDEAKAKIKKAFPELKKKPAEAIALAAVKYSFLKVRTSQEIAFDFKESINLEGNSGPYLLYTYARTRSVLGKANFQFSMINFQSIFNDKFSINKEELAILRTIYKFPEVVAEAGREYAPNLIANYLYDLAQKYNSFYNRHRIIKTLKQKSTRAQEQKNIKTMKLRLLLTRATGKILKNGLGLLGIETVEKM